MRVLFSLLLVISAIAVNGASARQPLEWLNSPKQIPTSRWTLDLSTDPAYRDAAGTENSSKWLSLSFVDDSTIVIVAQFQSIARESKTQDLWESLRSNGTVLAIDAKQGTVLRRSQVWKGWPGVQAVLGSKIYPVGKSECLVGIGNQLVKFSPTLDVLARRELPLNRTEYNGHVHQDIWKILTDARMNKALLVRFPFSPNGPPAAQDAHWIAPETLEDESTNSVPRWNTASLVGDSVIFDGSLPAKELVRIQKADNLPHPLCPICTGWVGGTFGDGLTFLGIHSYLVVDTNGTIRYAGKRVGGRYDSVNGISGAVTVNRVAFLFGHLGRDLKETLVVLDVDAKREVLRFNIDQRAERIEAGGFVGEHFTAPVLALSPNGKRLAIATGTVVSLYDVP